MANSLNPAFLEGAVMRFFYFLPLILLLPICGCNSKPQENVSTEVMPVKTIELSHYSDAAPDRELNLLFIHHSCGGNWLAAKGPAEGEDCINSTHPNGGGLRALLEQNGYRVHEASYHSVVGDKTDIEDWPAKFRDEMDRILQTEMQDSVLPEGETNSIVMFKPCYPNNYFVAEGSGKGRTVSSAKAAYESLLPLFRQHPEVLFIAVTAPPLVPPYETKNPVKALAKKVLGRYTDVEAIGRRARIFNNWLKDAENGWLGKYDLENVVVFDYYDILTKEGQSNWAKYPTKEGKDSHPSSEGNSIAAEKFVPFLNKSVRRAGLSS
jgi:hypothetical protein